MLRSRDTHLYFCRNPAIVVSIGAVVKFSVESTWHASVRVTSILLEESEAKETVICVHQHQHTESIYDETYVLEAFRGDDVHVAVEVGPNADDHVGVLRVCAARIHGVILQPIVGDSGVVAALPRSSCNTGMAACAFEIVRCGGRRCEGEDTDNGGFRGRHYFLSLSCLVERHRLKSGIK